MEIIKKFRKITLFTLIVILFISLYKSQYFSRDKIILLMNEHSKFSAIVYISIYSIAILLFIPVSPFAIVGGLFFGPVKGTLYTVIAALIGASLSFMLARYFLKEWFEKKIKKTKLKKLYDSVERNGWKIIAITRLIPVFPYNFFNYIFGATNIKFSHYILTSFIFMLPSVIVYNLFGSSILDILEGRITKKFIIGSTLLLIMLFATFLFKKSNNDE